MRLIGVAFLVVFLTSCDSGQTEAPTPPKPPPAAPTRPAAPPPAAAVQAPPEVPLPAGTNPALTDPSLAAAVAPASYKAKFSTTKGDFVIEVTRSWAPLGADRFYNLVKVGYFDDVAFFRVISGFMVQFGIHGYPAVNDAWRKARIQDDPVTQSNTPGMVTFATSGPNTRTSQVFINFGNNASLDAQGFSPFGKVVSGMDVVNKLYNGYGEGAPRGKGPSQGDMQRRGNPYLKEGFPELDYIKNATIVE